ncbi:MAG: hypothetical protein HC904_04560, partial [Blastochloris sp.]|nr:hypothetical protein [Blastochloris sp.]
MNVAVVDYGLGNLHSVVKALLHLGAKVSVATQGAELKTADRIILPGVGAFADGMEGLRRCRPRSGPAGGGGCRKTAAGHLPGSTDASWWQ